MTSKSAKVRAPSAAGTNRSATKPNAAPAGSNGTPNKKLAELTCEKIEMRIIEMGWPVGEVIGSEADLVAEYGVSRAAFREAVRLLEHHNVANMRRGPGGGLVVAEPDPDAMAHAAAVYLRYRKVNVPDLFEARIALELAAARSAAEHIDEAGIVKLRDGLAHESTFLGGESDATIHDFHVMVAELSGNPALHLFINVLTQLSAARFLGTTAMFDKKAARSAGSAKEVDEAHRAHKAIADAIIAGDAALAQHRTLKHLTALAAAAG
ncbi:FCD domain-containing protein [Dactylosporangium sp. AC04546]|uniref:FadR/GntR family transcriptional regulator n=1 Tax=Dactylosporangium sp. AC04546 TaxID=2862460 RepID=UPI001EDE4388|nr:FCD domain-containing protein [Dactylosporangium sp. AC04546]WVK86975.1 FCD domain-containing protein [Dactylosporangium sp. AC04546]